MSYALRITLSTTRSGNQSSTCSNRSGLNLDNLRD
jgi:hypothetical protein